MLRGEIKKVTKEIQANPSGGDDIFIVCASFEDRTIAVTERMAENIRVENTIIFKYDEKNRTSYRDINFEKLKNKLLNRSKIIYPIICNHHDPLDGIMKFKDLTEQKKINLENKNVFIDMTTFTKQYILVLFKFIESKKPHSVRIFYAEPQNYAIRWDKPLSSGIIDIISVPAFGGHYYVEKENLLILQLGYEGDRAYGLWEKCAPHKTIILIGKPSYKKTWEGKVEKMNYKLLSKLSKDSIQYISSLDPFKVSSNLDCIIEKYSPKFNIAISPLGPKPQVLGCYLSIKKYPDVQIIYAIPKSHEEIYFSKKIGRIWEYC